MRCEGFLLSCTHKDNCCQVQHHLLLQQRSLHCYMLMLKPLCVIETMLFYGAVCYTYGRRWEQLAGRQAELRTGAHALAHAQAATGIQQSISCLVWMTNLKQLRLLAQGSTDC